MYRAKSGSNSLVVGQDEKGTGDKVGASPFRRLVPESPSLQGIYNIVNRGQTQLIAFGLQCEAKRAALTAEID